MNYLFLLLQCFMYIAGVAFFCYDQKRRKYFIPFFICSIAIFLSYFFVFEKVLRGIYLYDTINYLAIWAMMFGGVILCFDIRPITTFFFTTCGYCLQHISQRIHYLLVVILLKIEYDSPISLTLAVLINVSVVALFGYVYKRFFFKSKNEPRIDNSWQLILTSCSMIVSIWIENMGTEVVLNADLSYTGGCFITSILFAIIVVLLEYCLVSDRTYRDENRVLKQIMERERVQYEAEKNVMEMLNIKCHDLKHLCMSGELSPEMMAETKRIADLYDSFYKTGNTTLDTVLTMKGMVCDKKGIDLSCIAGGEYLSFMSDSDIYSLFGNIIDNAIEAVEGLPEEKRAVNVHLKKRGQFLFLITENYYEGQILIKNGVIQTLKQDKNSHGFGLKSIKYITNKYGGDLKIDTDGGIFRLSVMFICQA